MPSKARSSLDENLGDIDVLLALHSMTGGDAPGRRYGLEVLNKSAIVLITACWEAYCEDLASEALAHIVKFSKSSDALPDELKRQIAKEIKGAQHELEVWKVADDGWKLYLTSRLGKLTEERNRRLNRNWRPILSRDRPSIDFKLLEVAYQNDHRKVKEQT
jgi:hypothetical protein